MEKVDRRREKILQYIEERLSAGSSPTVREICEDMHIPSTSTVHSDLKHLVEIGAIEMRDGLNRTIRLPGDPGVRVPLVGSVAAGVPILAVENIEKYISIALPGGYSGKRLFALRVQGDSMINAAILPDDIIVIEKTPVANNGQIVVALVGDDATVKRYYKENGHHRLQPENDSYEPIIVDNVDILGRVVSVIRYYN